MVIHGQSFANKTITDDLSVHYPDAGLAKVWIEKNTLQIAKQTKGSQGVIGILIYSYIISANYLIFEDYRIAHQRFHGTGVYDQTDRS